MLFLHYYLCKCRFCYANYANAGFASYLHYVYVYEYVYVYDYSSIKSMHPAHKRVNAPPFFFKNQQSAFFQKNFNFKKTLILRLTIQRISFILNLSADKNGCIRTSY